MFFNTNICAILVIVIWINCDYLNGADVIVTTPEWILLGSRAHMRCTLTLDLEGDTLNNMAWYGIDDFTHTDPTTAPNIIYYVVNGNIIDGDEFDRVDLNTTDLSLTIREVLPFDERKYFCRVLTNMRGEMFDSGISRVSVPPISLSITQVELVNGTTKTITCISNHGKPAATLSWRLGNTPLQSQPQRNTSDGDGGYYDSESMLQFTPLWSNHNDILTCTANVPADATGIADSITLDVQVPPYDANVFIYDSDDIDKDDVIDVVDGEQHVLTCKVMDTRPSAEFEWFINGIKQTTGIGPPTAIPSSPEYNDLVNTTSTLTFVPERQNHNQIVVCRVAIPVSGTPDAEFSVTLKVFGPPDSPILTPPDNLNEGEMSLFECTASDAYPGGRIIWYNNDEEIRSSEVNNTKPNGRYDITDSFDFTLQRSDNKHTITCEARHETLQVPNYLVDSIEIDVKFCSTGVQVTSCPSVEVGYSAMLSCMSSSSNPPATLEWYKDDIKMSNTHQSIQEPGENEGQSTTLQFTTRLMERKDVNRVNFTCCAIDTMAGCAVNCSNLCKLNVQYRPENVLFTKSTHIPLMENYNEPITLTCSADGNPLPYEFTWYQDGSPVYGEYASSLTYLNAQRENAGLYRCVAGNGLSTTGESPLGNITVYYSNNITNKGENIKSVEVQQNITMNCIAEGLPRPEMSWKDPKGNILPSDDDRITIEEQIEENDGVHGTRIKSQLNIDDVKTSDYGSYACIASNSIGQPDLFIVNLDGTSKYVPTPNNLGAIIGSTVGVIIAILIVVICILVYYISILRKQRRERDTDDEANTGSTTLRLTNTGKVNEIEQHGGTGKSGFAETDFNGQEPYVNSLLKQFIFPRGNLHILTELGHGEFGKVFSGIAIGIVSGEKETQVAVKTLKDNADNEAKQQLIKEFNLMKSLMPALVNEKNRNVVQLLGGCMNEDPICIILEYMKNGNLKNLLRESRTIGDGIYSNLFAGSKCFTPTQLIGFAQQVANGMDFLARQKCIHRDLAARNVLLNETFKCKVSDFGLAEDVMNVEVYRRQNECRLPLRWMAIESVLGDVHTIESDVWSFGVLLWEIVTLGSRPYPKLKGSDVQKLLKNGQRMPQPKHCSEQLYNIMLVCWEKEPSKRPSFEKLMRLLDEVLEGENGYLSLVDFETKVYEDVSLPAPNEKV
ncbi:fibroblast growth factor receptor-like [Amphiura filiformis]|uniref:fibroblast growth factor receptor-like n=1 Tax=Amphiura filiformis TaxID=82378 RepID=UPI003B215C38